MASATGLSTSTRSSRASSSGRRSLLSIPSLRTAAMPANQHGSVVKRGSCWQARYRDEKGQQRGEGGFPTRTAARDWLDDRIKEVAALRRGDLIPVAHRPQTVTGLLDLFEERHGQNIDPATLRKLQAQLKHARAAFGDRHPDSPNRLE